MCFDLVQYSFNVPQNFHLNTLSFSSCSSNTSYNSSSSNNSGISSSMSRSSSIRMQIVFLVSSKSPTTGRVSFNFNNKLFLIYLRYAFLTACRLTACYDSVQVPSSKYLENFNFILLGIFVVVTVKVLEELVVVTIVIATVLVARVHIAFWSVELNVLSLISGCNRISSWSSRCSSGKSISSSVQMLPLGQLIFPFKHFLKVPT